MNKNFLDPELYNNWIDFVVALNQENWLKVVQSLYSSVDHDRLPHIRFSLVKTGCGAGIRFLASKDSDLVKKLKKVSTDLEIRYSVNPKENENDPLRDLSAWYDSPETFDMTREWADLLHALSESAILALKTGFSKSSWRARVVHQFCNMMALTDSPYLSIFRLRRT